MNKTFKHKETGILKKPAFLLLLAFMFHFASAQQTVLMLSDTCPVGDPGISFDVTGLDNTNHLIDSFGNNDWVINSEYSGRGVYPNSPSEDTLLGGFGQIHGAPYSTYLHIHDITQPGNAANANWDPHSASDRFCALNTTFCTLGYTNVAFTFFWNGQGDSTAYGRVYFRINGGQWTPVGQQKYNNQHEWKYEAIHDPRFENVENLQFGFRWVNAGSDTTSDVSWAIDDIITVGDYNTTTVHSNFKIISVSPSPICAGDPLTINFTLDPPLCYGNYAVFLSDANGNFAHDSLLNPPAYLYPPYTSWTWTGNVPRNVQGNCFKVSIERVSPLPVFWSDTSICFSIQRCPVVITTLNAPVMNDADTTCVKSAIDIYFNSIGNLNTNNIYYAQLSDSNGDFTHPDTVGRLVSNESYPVKPGDISGLIPSSVPPGCGYTIRVISSSPYSVGDTIGPFCLTDCDVTTNNTIDLKACINYPYATDTLTFKIDDNQWQQGASYDTCNDWTIELLDKMSFAVVNIGGLGVYHDTASGTFTLIIPDQATLASLGIQPKGYYMRIISNCSNQSWNETGTVIRLTIGAPSAILGITSPDGDSIYCNTDEITMFPQPDNFNSNYIWTSNLLNGPFETFMGQGLALILTTAPTSDFVVYVQEENNGCLGPLGSYNVVITAPPVIKINGPEKVCLGDTAVFNASYLPATHYDWNAPDGVRVYIQSNTQVSMIFDSLGTFAIGEESVNECGDAAGTLPIKVYNLFNVDLGPDKLNCLGDSITLTADVPPYPKTFISLDSSVIFTQGGMFNISAHNDIIIDSFAVTFKNSSPANSHIAIYSKQGTYKTFEQSVPSWNLLANNIIPHIAPSRTKTVIPSELNKTILAGDTAAFYITTTDTPTLVYLVCALGTGIQQGTVFKSDGVVDFIQGSQNAYPFGIHAGPRVLDVTVYYRTMAGLKYSWNTGDTSSAISFLPSQSNLYAVKVYDTTGCRTNDTVFVKVDTLPRVYAGPDTMICPSSAYLMSAVASPTASISWNPVTGLDYPDTLNPVFNYNQGTDFIVTATNPDGCKGYDSVTIGVYSLSVDAGPDTTICDAQSYIMLGTASSDNVEWIPGAGLSATNILTPVFSYDQSTIYYLQVTDTNGCKLTDSVTINVVYCNTYIKVPDAFTPNGDGTNDHFTVFGQYISTYQIRIFNRWGEEVYSSNDVTELNDLSKGWDGTYKGKLQDVSTFVYVIEAKDLNGKSILKKGNLTLIR